MTKQEFIEWAMEDIVVSISENVDIVVSWFVGSKDCKYRLMEVLPEGANIICSPYIESPTMIYAIKKFDTMDLLFDPPEGWH